MSIISLGQRASSTDLGPYSHILPGQITNSYLFETDTSPS